MLYDSDLNSRNSGRFAPVTDAMNAKTMIMPAVMKNNPIIAMPVNLGRSSMVCDDGLGIKHELGPGM